MVASFGEARKCLLFVLAAGLIVFASFFILTGCGSGAASNSALDSSFAVTVAAPTAGWGTVTSNPQGIDCPTTCSASFVANTQIELTATPAANYVFNGWTGSCSGAKTCNLTVSAAQNATAIFAPAKGSNVIAYVFTPDSLELKSSEFALLADGKLQPMTKSLQSLVMTGTSQGLVADVFAGNGTMTPELQLYTVRGNGSLQAVGSPVTVAMDRYLSLTSGSSYIYAATDEGLFGFEDQGSGMAPLQPIQLIVPPPASCTTAEENSNQCGNMAYLSLSNSNAFFLQSVVSSSASSLYQLSSFDQSEGQLTAEQLVAGDVISTSIFAPTPNGNFIYALDSSTNRVFRYTRNGNGTHQTDVLNGQKSLSDGFVQFLINAEGSLLFGLVSNATESPRIRVFRINSATGNLAEVAGSPFSTGEYYLQRGAIDPTGQFLLLVHANCQDSPPCIPPSRLVAMSINSNTGALAVTSDVEDGENPFSVTAVPISQ